MEKEMDMEIGMKTKMEKEMDMGARGGRRADMMRLLLAERPDLDVNDDEAVFGQIIDDYEDYARLLTEERERKEEETRRERQAEESGARFGAGHSPELAAAARRWVDNMTAAVMDGNYTAEAFEMAVKAMNYDRDVAQAELRGRNAQIREMVMAGPRGDD
ncbi:MAG: hypothetical protein NC548_56245, partial [Lachnospiraceae bacterium]|nr:hypothetical protein [Lachnospiraceae bacterium]